jgi:hypothetical protein
MTTIIEGTNIIGNHRSEQFTPAKKTTVTMVEVCSYLGDRVGYSITFHRHIGTNYLGGVWGDAPVYRIQEYRVKPSNNNGTVAMRMLDKIVNKMVAGGNASINVDSTHGYEVEIF